MEIGWPKDFAHLAMLPGLILQKMLTYRPVYHVLDFCLKLFIVLTMLELYNATTLALEPYLDHTPVRYQLIVKELTGVPDFANLQT
jgi:hypothetical protein